MLWVRPGVYFLGLDSVDSTPDGLGLRMPSHWTWLAERATFRKENYEIVGSPMKLCFQLIPSIAQQEHAVALLHLERELAYNQEILNNYLFSKLNLSSFFLFFPLLRRSNQLRIRPLYASWLAYAFGITCFITLIRYNIPFQNRTCIMHERRAFGLIIHLEGGVRHDLPNHMLKQPILFLDPHFVLPNDFSLQ